MQSLPMLPGERSRVAAVPRWGAGPDPKTPGDHRYFAIHWPAPGTLWYRFYDLDQDVGFFSGRLPTDNPPGVDKQYDIMAIEPERRYGYQWGGSYGVALTAYGDSVGY